MLVPDAAPSALSHPKKQLTGRWSEDGAPAGFVSDLDPEVRVAFGLSGELDSDVAVAVLDLDALPRGLGFAARLQSAREVPEREGRRGL